MAQNPWFNGQDQSPWFDVPTEALEQLQSDYQQQWLELGQQLLTRQPFSFEDQRFASNNWSEPLFGALAAFYLLNSGFC